MPIKPGQVISGTYAELWIDGEKFAEAYGMQAKIDILKEDIQICGVQSGRGKKMMGFEGKGTVRLHKINSKLLKKQLAALRQGKELTFTLVSKLADPAVTGSERISISGCTWDDIPIVDWEANKVGQEERPFTFNEIPDDLDIIA